MSVTCETLVSRLQESLIDTLRQAIGRPERIAVVDFPAYGNIGDSLIWLAQHEIFVKLGLPRPSYVATAHSFNLVHLREAIGNGTILLQGGGNFGDAYPAIQKVREAIIRGFPANRIVQLPQSIHFQSPAQLEQTRRIVSAHPALVLFVRDRTSYALAARELGGDVRLCPDVVFGLGPVARPPGRRHGILWLMRTDVESTGRWSAESTRSGERHADWRHETAPFHSRIVRGVERLGIRYPSRLGPLVGLRRATYLALARRRFEAARTLLGGAEAVVTDRLHGHVLCMLMSLPHVVMDNATGKVRALIDTWTSGNPLCRWAESPDEARLLAEDLLAQGRRA